MNPGPRRRSQEASVATAVVHTRRPGGREGVPAGAVRLAEHEAVRSAPMNCRANCSHASGSAGTSFWRVTGTRRPSRSVAEEL
ncbi:hypothetical protein [Nonomuraea sp. bgisy101]|uniref:hypothetical protein n=1 Tax=Nonomuraea sp. bgisy101 TaxID=3413784 RepID=UPI003D750054